MNIGFNLKNSIFIEYKHAVLFLGILIYSVDIYAKVQQKQPVLFLRVRINNYNDTLYLFWSPSFYYSQNDLLGENQIPKSANSDGVFEFSLSDSKIRDGYFCLARKVDSAVVNSASKWDIVSNIFHFNFGDSLEIMLTSRRLFYGHAFRGKNAKKYEIKYLLDSIYNAQSIVRSGNIRKGDFKLIDPFLYRMNASLNFLNQNRKRLSEMEYLELKAETLFKDSKYRFQILSTIYGDSLEKFNISKQKSIILYKQLINGLEESSFPDLVLKGSRSYLIYLLYKMSFEATFFEGRDRSNGLLDIIRKRFNGEIKEKLIALYVINFKLKDSELALYGSLYDEIQNNSIKEKLQKFANRLPGVVAYDFNLSDTNGIKYRLSDFKGKVVVIDFWFTGCPACVDYFQHVLSPIENKFKKSDSSVVFISISSDNSLQYWKKGLNSDKYASEQSINLFTDGKGSSHDLLKYYSIKLFPFILIIDQDGKIFRANTAELRDSSKLFQLINGLLVRREVLSNKKVASSH